jgi:hypothetical protein
MIIVVGSANRNDGDLFSFYAPAAIQIRQTLIVFIKGCYDSAEHVKYATPIFLVPLKFNLFNNNLIYVKEYAGLI